jgi:hypothetical protein
MAAMKTCKVARRAAQVLLVVLAAVFPFEAPLCRVGPLELTTVEVVLYVTLAAWGITVALEALNDRERAWGARLRDVFRADGAAQASVGWALVLFGSALAAPSFRGAALKFALRSLSGILLFFAVRTLARPPEVARRVVAALLGGAVVSAATGVLDWFVPATGPLWSPFRNAAFHTLGLTRASGVFAYPTIGAMYWEAAIALVVAAPALAAVARVGRSPSIRVATAIGASVLLIGAILASATRSGLVGAAVACVAMMALGGRTFGRTLVASSVGVLAVVVGWSALVMAAPSSSLLGQRMRFWHDDNWLRAEYGVDASPHTARAREEFSMTIRVHNVGSLAWEHDGPQPTLLGYHWERSVGPSSLEDYEGARSELSADVPPGDWAEVTANLKAPGSAGTYTLHWDLLQEGVTWFSDLGNPTGDQVFAITRASETQYSTGPRHPRVTPAPPAPSRKALWRAAIVLWRMRPILGVGPDNFRRRYEAVLPRSPNGQPYTDQRIHANNLYFETLADLGLVGFAVLGWIAWSLGRLIAGHASSGRLLGLATGVSAAAFFVHGVLDYFFEFTPLFGLFWLLFGLTSSARAPAPRDTPP